MMQILLYGYGLEGRSSERFLRSKYPESKITIVDDGNSDYLNITDVDLSIFDLICLSPGIPYKKVISKDLQSVCTSNTKLFFNELTANQLQRVIGISGSKGKSTTALFLQQLLDNAGCQTALAGNFGLPLLEVLEDLQNHKIDYVVAELSSFQLDGLTVSPQKAIFTSYFPEHLDWHADETDYQTAKQNLWKHQDKSGTLVTPRYVCPLINTNGYEGNLIKSQPLEPTFFPENSIYRAQHFCKNLGTIYSIWETIVKDTWNQLENIEKDKVFAKTAQNYQGIRHRLEKVTTKNQVTYYNDSIATNIPATLAAVQFFGDQLGSLILGGRDLSQSDPIPLIKALTEKNPQCALILIQSPVADNVLRTLEADQLVVHTVQNLDEAVKMSVKATGVGKICLLSPAGKSFDQFKNYQERGDRFCTLVNSL